MAETLGRATLDLDTDDARFNQGVDRAHGKAGKLGDEFERVGNIAIAAFAAMAAGVAVLVKGQIDFADKITKMAQSVGFSTKALSEYDHVAKLSGVSTEALGTSLGRLSRNILDTSAGTGDAAGAFEALNISVKNSDGTLKSSEQIMGEVADRFAEMEDGTGKTALAMMLFGRAGMSMIPMLNQGSKGMAELRQEARDLGVGLDTETGQAAERFNDNLTRLNQVKRGIGNTIMKELLPPLNALTDAWVRSAKEAGAFSTVAAGTKVVFQAVAILGANVNFVLGVFGREIGGLAAQMAAVARLDLKAFDFIRVEMVEDAKRARAELDAFELRILGIGEQAKTTGNALAEMAKKQAPAIANKEALKAVAAVAAERLEEMKKAAAKELEELKAAKAKEKALLEESTRGWLAHADGVFAAAEEELLALAQIQAQREQAMESLRLAVMTEQEREVEAHALRVAQLGAALEAGLITQQQFNERLEQAQKDHQARLTAIHDKGLTERQRFEQKSLVLQAQTIFGELANITAGVAQHNKALFRLNQVAGIANAIINAYIGISKTLAAYPYPINIALAAAHAVAAFAQVNAIRKQQFGDGGAAPSIAGSTAATPVTPVTSGVPEPAVTAQGGAQPAAERVANINIFADPSAKTTYGEVVDDILPAIEEAVANGATRLNVQLLPA